jgi:hypothetical protein
VTAKRAAIEASSLQSDGCSERTTLANERTRRADRKESAPGVRVSPARCAINVADRR